MFFFCPKAVSNPSDLMRIFASSLNSTQWTCHIKQQRTTAAGLDSHPECLTVFGDMSNTTRDFCLIQQPRLFYNLVE